MNHEFNLEPSRDAAHEDRTIHDGHGDHTDHVSAEAGGLAVSDHGYTLELDAAILDAGRQQVMFTVTGPDGLPVTEFAPSHEKELHFIAVRRDTAGFQHVHPVMSETGVWGTELELTPGTWRFFADFQPAGHAAPMTLGIDAFVAGLYEPQRLPEPVGSTRLGQYSVSLTGQLLLGQASNLAFSVARNGEPVTDLEPYLAAYGHLVALRVGDLGYLHVHPEGEPGDGDTTAGPEITFMAAAPSPGAYRLFLDFQHEGVVRTAEFTVHATRAGAERDTHGHSHH